MSKPITEQESKPYEFLFQLVRKQMGFVPNSMKTMARVPAILGAFGSLAASIIGNTNNLSPLTAIKLTFKNMGWMSQHIKNKDRVPLHLKNLVAHVSSNASGCRYCQAHTIGEAEHNGATKEQLEAVWDFENSTLFSAAEKAALRFGFAAGSVPNAVTETHFEELRQYYTEAQIVELGATIALFGFLNRWNDTFGTTLEAPAIANAEKYLKKSGWEIGKHQ